MDRPSTKRATNSGWEEVKPADGGQPYFANRETGESAWRLPATRSTFECLSRSGGEGGSQPGGARQRVRDSSVTVCPFRADGQHVGVGRRRGDRRLQRAAFAHESAVGHGAGVWPPVRGP